MRISVPDLALAHHATGCICGKDVRHEGTCVFCGHGRATQVSEHAYALNMRANTSAPLDGRATVLKLPTERKRRRGEWDEDSCIDAARRWEREHGSLPKAIDWQAAMNGFKRPSYGTVYKLFGGWQGFMRAIAEIPNDQTEVAV